MREFVIWLLVNAISVFMVATILPGVQLQEGIGPLLLVALLIGIVNALLRPILYLLSCGVILLTLGLVIPILNALLLLLVDELAGSAFEVDGFLWAVVAAIIMWLINVVLESLLGDDHHKQPEKNRS